MGVPEDVPEGICGFTMEPEDVDEGIDVESQEWYEAISGVCCFRDAWEGHDTDRCVWHAESEGKTAADLSPPRTDDPERLYGAYVGGAELMGIDRLRGIVFLAANFSDADLSEADLSNVELPEADLQGTDLSDANLSDAELPRADLSDADLAEADLSDADLTEADLSDADLVSANLSNANLRRGNSSGANFLIADLSDANLVAVDLSDASLGGADLSDASVAAANLSGADLSNADLSAADLFNTDLSDAILLDTNLINANLANTTLTDARLSAADLTNATLERANLTRADLFDADLTGTRPYGVVLADVQIDTATEFGGHYPDDVDKGTWTLAQIEDLSRQNALPGQFRTSFTQRKDRRRSYYWHHSMIPEWIRMPIGRVNTAIGGLVAGLVTRLRQWVNDEPNRTGEIDPDSTDTGGSKDEDVETEPDVNDGEDPISPDPTPEAPSGEAASDTESEAESSTSANTGDENEDTDEDSDADLTNWERWTNTTRWAWAALTGVTMRYGESPRRVVGVSVATMAAFGLAYPLVGGVVDGGATYRVSGLAELASPAGIEAVARGLYFSLITFTTIGYANVAPNGPGSRVLVGLESFAGALLMATLVFVLGRRSTR